MQSFKPALIGACGLAAFAVWSLADAQNIARAADASCAPILESMKKQLALPVFGATSTLDDGPEKKFVYTQTDIFTATENGRWRKKLKSTEERDQGQWLAKYSSQLHACSTGVPDTLNGSVAKLYVAQLGTVLIRKWIGQADGLPMQQEATLPGTHKRVTVWNYNHVAVPASDTVDAE